MRSFFTEKENSLFKLQEKKPLGKGGRKKRCGWSFTQIKYFYKYLAKYHDQPLRGETYIPTLKKASKRKKKKPARQRVLEKGLFPPLIYDFQDQKEKPNEAGKLPKKGIYSVRVQFSYIMVQERNFLWCKP